VTVSEIVTVVSAIATVVALVVVSYQTALTRKAVEASQVSLDLTRESLIATQESMTATKQSTDLAIRTMQIEMLPKANWIITVQVELEAWLRDLSETAAAVASAHEAQSTDTFESLARGGLSTPVGLVRRHAIEHMPDWLTTIWFAAAQYYYTAKCNQGHLWNQDEGTPRASLAPDFVARCHESSAWIQDLLEMLHDVVPQAYLEAPARLSDDRFFDGPG